MTNLTIPTAKVFKPLLHPARYKGAHGGRGSAKSTFFAEDLVDHAIRWPGDTGEGLRVLSYREIQKSLKESAKFLIEKSFKKFGIGEKDGVRIYTDRIALPKDGVIAFTGMQDHTADSVKSYEGFHIAWGEEAQSISSHSLRLLRPTIRWESKNLNISSELWFSWNPRFRSDAVDNLLRGEEKPSNATVVQANWKDNPWFPNVLEEERQDCLRIDPDGYEHIWEGDYATVSAGAYYAKHIVQAKQEGRITVLTPDPLLTYRAFVDIGGTGAKADSFVIWIAQFVGSAIYWLDHYEVQGQPLASHLIWLRENGYTSDRCQIWLPHDGATQDKVHAVSYESALKQAGYTVTVVPNQGKGAAKKRIEAMRRLFPSMFFDAKKCEAGLGALGWYHEKKDETRNIGLGPEHDFASHSCLIGETLIKTTDGLKPIADIKTGEIVNLGVTTAKVAHSGFVRLAETLIIELDNGQTLECTPEHKIFTTRGLVRAGALSYNDTLSTWECPLWNLSEHIGTGIRKSITGNIEALDTGFGERGNSIAVKSAINRASYIEWFGKVSMDLCRQGMKSISWMAIEPISNWITWLFERGMQEGSLKNDLSLSISTGCIITESRKDITKQDMKTVVNCYIEQFGNSIMGRSQKGTTYTTATITNSITGLGICNAYHKQSIFPFMQRKMSGLAAKPIKSSLLQRPKNRKNGTGQKRVENGIVSMVKRFLIRSQHMKKNANDVGIAIKQNSRKKPCTVQEPVRVVRIGKSRKLKPVYDLTIEKHQCYYANGVLVSNSDAAGLGAIVYQPPKPKRVKHKAPKVNVA